MYLTPTICSGWNLLMTAIYDRKDKLLQDLKDQGGVDDRFRFLISRAKQLPEMDTNEKTDAYLIKGCLSRAWLFPKFENGLVYFKADSEAAIVKGIIASIVNVYSGSKPSEILALSPDFLAEGGISEALSMNRRSGLANILKQVRLYALAYQAMEPK